MAHTIEPHESETISCDSPTTLLAHVVSNGSVMNDSLFVLAPKYGEMSFHTHNSGFGYHHKPDYDLDRDLLEYDTGDYVRLHYEPYPDRYDKRMLYLDRVTDASVTEPEYETMGDTETPGTCPQCGQTGAAVVRRQKVESEFSDIAINPEADMCDVAPERLAWFDCNDDCIYIH